MSIDPNNLSGTAKLTFSDEFDGNSLDSSVWKTAYPWNAANGGTNLSNQEEQWYINSNYGPTAALAADTYQVKDGMLHIKAQPTPTQYKQDVDGYDYTSGMITTHGNFEQKYGYFEMRADIPSGKGMWPAFWLLQPDAWPPELDVMEVIGDKPDDLLTSVHYNDGSNKLINKATQYPGLSDGFQTYGVNWQADTITWYLNGEKVFEVDTPADLDDPMYMLVNLAVGGTWPGSPDGNTQFPATMSVDYIRAYSELPEGMTPPVSVPEVEEDEEVVAEVVDEVVDENPVTEEDVAKDEAAKDEAAGEETAQDEAAEEDVAKDEAAEEEVAQEETAAEDNEVEASEEDQEETAKVPDADDVVAETPDEAEEVEQSRDAEEVVEDEEVEEPEEQVAEVDQVVEEKTPVEASPETGNSGNSANWDKFIESFAGFGKNGSGNDGWSKFADKFSAKADDFAAKKGAFAEKMLAKKSVESEDDASDVFGGFASAASSGRDLSKIFQGNGFEVGNAKRDFGFQRMEAINDRIASFQEKGMGTKAQKFEDLDMGDFDLSKSFAEGISDQAVPQSVFDFA